MEKYIDAMALSKILQNKADTVGLDYRPGFLSAAKLCAALPAADVEPVRHGRWIPTGYDGYADGAPVWDEWECSECAHEHSGDEDTLTAFCPDCGAKMDEEVE